MLIAAAEAGCDWGDLNCVANEAVSNFADGVAGRFVESLAESTLTVLAWINTFWMDVPTPDVESSAVAVLQANMAWYTYAFAILGIFLAIGKMVVANDFKAGAPAVKMVINLIIVTGFYTTAVALLLKAGDAFAPWIIERALGEPMQLDGMLTVAMFSTPGIGPGLLLVILAFLGSLANLAFMIARAVFIAILVTFLPILAASSASETGEAAWKKAQGYLLAFLLFKPVAAVILALGLLMISDPPNTPDTDAVGLALFQVITGILTLLMVALALPMLIKFIVPVAGAGTSAAFSGGAVAAGAVAAGAAVVAVGATGGAAAVAGAGGAAGAGAAGGAGAGAAGGGTGGVSSAASQTGSSGGSAGAATSAPGTGGSDGSAGARGSSGSDGARGSSGSDGASGTSGADGQTASGGSTRSNRSGMAANAVASGVSNANDNLNNSSEDES